MTDDNQIKAALQRHLGGNQKPPVNFNPDAQPDDGWTPPALNDDRRLKADLMAALQGNDDDDQTNSNTETEGK